MNPKNQPTSTVSERLGHLEATVEGIRGEMGQLSSAIAGLSRKLDAKTQPQYGILISFASLLVLLIGAFFRAPLSDQEKHSIAIAELRKDYSTRGEWMGQMNGAVGRIEQGQEEIDRKIAAQAQRIDLIVREDRDVYARLAVLEQATKPAR